MGEEISWKKMLRYVGGESDPGERAEVEAWIASDKKRASVLSFIEKIEGIPAEPKEDWDIESAWLRYNIRHGRDFDKTWKEGAGEEEWKGNSSQPGRLNLEGEEDQQERTLAGDEFQTGKLRPSAGSGAKLFTWGSVAAAAAMIGLILFYTLPADKTPVSEEPALKQIVSEYGQRTHLRLSDGTRVILNAGSRIVVPETFSDTARTVRLEGQAFFNVAAESIRPFRVYTDHSVTEVRGTKFDVRAYSGEGPIEVTVAEGTVLLRPKRDAGALDSREITMNQKGSLSPSGVTTVTEVEDPAEQLGWIKGNLVFANEPLSRVKATLERYYNIRIEPRGSSWEPFKRLRFTGSFSDSQSLEEVLEAIALSLKVQFEEAAADGMYTLSK